MDVDASVALLCCVLQWWNGVFLVMDDETLSAVATLRKWDSLKVVKQFSFSFFFCQIYIFLFAILWDCAFLY
jgi:hypothetical protein